MNFPLKLNTGEEVAVTLGTKELRFVANYPHAFHSAEALEACAVQARDGRYDGLSLLDDESLYMTMNAQEIGGLYRPSDLASLVAELATPAPRKPAGFFRRLRNALTGR